MITKYDNFTYSDNKKEIGKLDSSFSNKITIEKSLEKLFEGEKEFISILSGEWGIGKTFFWKDFIKRTNPDKKHVYISLFGHNSINDIKTNILLEVSKTKKRINWINKHTMGKLKSIKSAIDVNDDMKISLDGGLLNTVFSLLTQGDFKNIIICFDDIERMSNKIELKDFMGFLSELKEKNECKVIIILNENELVNLSQIDGKPHNEIFALYKEKIVNYEFHYKPGIQDCFDISMSLKKVKYFDEKKEIKNIRVITQCIYHLNKFTFIKDYGLNDKTIDKFLQSALTAFTFKTIHNLSENKFEEFKKYKKSSSWKKT